MTPADLEPARGKPAPSAKSLRKAGAQSLECKRKVPLSADPPPEPNKKKKTRLSLADTNKKSPPLEQAAETNKPLPLEHAAMTNNKPLPLEHAWTPDDEVQILEAMAAHRRAEQGKLPRSGELFASLNGRLDSNGFGQKELRRKMRSLKRRHDDDVGVIPAAGHECRVYHLSKNVWGTNSEPKVPKTFDEMRQMYPCLVHEAVHIIPEPAVLERLLIEIDDRKADALNAKINDLREELTHAIMESAKVQNIQVPKGWQCPHNKLRPAKSRVENYLDRLDKVLGACDVAQKQFVVAQGQHARMDGELVKLKQDIIASGPPKDIRCESAESAPQSVVAEKQFSYNVMQRKIPAQEKLAGGNDEVTSKYRPSKNLSGKMVFARKRMHRPRKEKLDAESQILHDTRHDTTAGIVAPNQTSPGQG